MRLEMKNCDCKTKCRCVGSFVGGVLKCSANDLCVSLFQFHFAF